MNIDEVVRHAAHLLSGYFLRADIESAVHLPRIHGNNLATARERLFDRAGGLA